jgi:hypothetical protein
MNGDTAAALRQIRLALRRLLGPRLQPGPPDESRCRRAKAATATNDNREAKPAASEAKATGR